jgi:hypothetical protein
MNASLTSPCLAKCCRSPSAVVDHGMPPTNTLHRSSADDGVDVGERESGSNVESDGGGRPPRQKVAAASPLHLRFPVPRAKFCFYGTAGARMSVPGASIGQRRSRRIRSKSVVRSKVQRIMLGVILRATSNIRGSHMFSPDTTPKRPMLRPVLRATSNIMSPPPSSFTCLQHRNSSSARLKINICNIQHQGPSPLLLSTQYPISHVCDIETQHP